LQQSIRVQFDRFLMPVSATRQGVCVTASSNVGTGIDCPGGVQLEAHYDPVDRVAVWVPSAPLSPSTRYTVRLVTPLDSSDPNGIRAFDGVPLAAGTPTFGFMTGDASSQPTLAEPNRPVIDFCANGTQLCPIPSDVCSKTTAQSNQTIPPFDIVRGCALTSMCHGALSEAQMGIAGSTLVLGNSGMGDQTPQYITDLVMQRRVANETATGPNPNGPDLSGNTPFGENMPYLAAGDPGQSFLLYKVLLGMTQMSQTFSATLYDCAAVNAALTTTTPCTSTATPVVNSPAVVTQGQTIPAPVDSWVPDGQSGPPPPDEIARLKRYIRGVAMPYFPFAGLPRAQVLTLSAWIEQGATAHNCN
jgi:hypothetical protein